MTIYIIFARTDYRTVQSEVVRYVWQSSVGKKTRNPETDSRSRHKMGVFLWAGVLREFFESESMSEPVTLSSCNADCSFPQHISGIGKLMLTR